MLIIALYVRTPNRGAEFKAAEVDFPARLSTARLSTASAASGKINPQTGVRLQILVTENPRSGTGGNGGLGR